MEKRIHHIGIAVKDLEGTVRFFRERLGLEDGDRVEWPGLKAALLPLGDVILELIEPREVRIPVAESLMRLVEDRGGGVHHLCIEVDDIGAQMEAMKADGIQFMTEGPQDTAGGKIAWLREGTVDGLMVELCEQGYKILSG